MRKEGGYIPSRDDVKESKKGSEIKMSTIDRRPTFPLSDFSESRADGIQNNALFIDYQHFLSNVREIGTFESN